MLNKLKNLIGTKSKDKNASPKPSGPDKNTEWLPDTQTSSPEELCGIAPNTMSRDAIRKQLAVLYKRHNSAVSSLNPELRAEAVIMLDAIVECRQRYIDVP